MVVVGAVAEIETRHGHACTQQLLKNLRRAPRPGFRPSTSAHRQAHLLTGTYWHGVGLGPQRADHLQDPSVLVGKVLRPDKLAAAGCANAHFGLADSRWCASQHGFEPQVDHLFGLSCAAICR